MSVEVRFLGPIVAKADGKWTDTPFPLGRHVVHDSRSRQFAFGDVVGRREVRDIYWNRQVPIFDQGSLGSCTGNAAAGWIASDNMVRSGLSDLGQFGVVNQDLAVKIYAEATGLDPFEGTFPPDDTGSDGLSVAKVLKRMGLVDLYTHCFSFEELLWALQSGPVLVGTNWYRSMFFASPDGTVSIGLDDPNDGGHEYLAIGVDTITRQVRFANSWGPNWGASGYFRMNYSTVERLLAEHGDATVLHPMVTTPELPPFWLDSILRWLRALFARLTGSMRHRSSG